MSCEPAVRVEHEVLQAYLEDWEEERRRTGDRSRLTGIELLMIQIFIEWLNKRGCLYWGKP